MRFFLPLAVFMSLPAVVLAAEQEQGGLVLDDVTVSAHPREEHDREVAHTMSALDGEQLEAAGLQRSEDLQQRVPSLLVSMPNPRYASYGIRGLGASSANDGIDGSVGVYLDGVYLGRQGMSLFDLADIERVEVLRGPQGTLYGRSGTAGAINILTRRPTFDTEANGEVTMGEDGLREYRGSVSGPLLDGVLAGRLTGYDVARDGQIDNLYDGSHPGDRNRQGLRGQLSWVPSEVFSARLIGEYAWQDEQVALLAGGYSAPTRARAAYLGHRLLPLDPYARRVQSDQPSCIRTRQNGVTLELIRTLGNGASLTSITGYRDWRYDTDMDADGQGLSIAGVSAQLDHRQFSQELRLADSPNEHVDYVVGLYYLRQRLDRQIDNRFGEDAAAWFLGDRPEVAGLPPDMIPPSLLDGTRQTFDGGQRSDSRALFGQFTWHATDRLAITPGLRYTTERKRGWIARQVSALAPLPPGWQLGQELRDLALGDNDYRRNSIEEHNLSGRLAVAYRLQDGLLAYASWARGYKAGGINLDMVGEGVEPTFDAERATSLEIGLKSSFWRERVLFDLALYQTDVDGYQVLTNRPGDTELSPPIRDNLINVPEVRLRGVELDGLLRASPRIDLRLGLAWSEARYRDFANAPCAPGSVQQLCDLSGKRLFNAPQWSGTAGIDYRHPLEQGLELFTALDYSFRSGYSGTLEGGAGSYLPSYELTNLRLGLRRGDRRWEGELWVRNLFDQHYIGSVQALLADGDYAVLPGDARAMGVTLRGRY
ncbi:TonB-dependent receptor [Pseudomonas lopnurensis]|uniref:TonB-dependent receptor n=1 Tax=Pseudomonas lopnurensis TaxID=1477517 RepID=UPI0028A5BA87|nr:TonB-dependent receptor [Pseudomonas lopnurensis]